MSDTFAYTAELQLTDGSTVPVDLEERGWAEPERLSQTRVFSLVPKVDGWPRVKMHIPEDAKPIFKARRSVGMTAGFEFRSYAVGWFKDGESHWTWILPDGSVEYGTDEPEFIEQMTIDLNEQWRQRVGAPNGQQSETD